MNNIFTDQQIAWINLIFVTIFSIKFIVWLVGHLGVWLEKQMNERELEKIRNEYPSFKWLTNHLLAIRSKALKSKTIETQSMELQILGGVLMVTYTFDGTKDD